VNGWIGVDLDGTLAHYEGFKGAAIIGAPIAPMVDRVKRWLAAGKTVKIFTARMHGHGMPLIGGGVEDVLTPIENWCREHIGQVLPITNVKDFGMIELWDDRVVQVESNTGIPVASCKNRKRRSLLHPTTLALCVECGKSPATHNGRCQPCSLCVASEDA